MTTELPFHLDCTFSASASPLVSKSRKFRHQKVSTGVCAYGHVGSSENLHYNASSTHTPQVADFKVVQ